jgi:hypothetical protein
MEEGPINHWKFKYGGFILHILMLDKLITYIVCWYSLFGDSENRGKNYLKIRDLLSIALFNILGTHYSIHIRVKVVKEIIQIMLLFFHTFLSARFLGVALIKLYETL